MLTWYFVVYFRMEHICLTFYTIKYPVLLASPHVSGSVAIVVWLALVFRRVIAAETDDSTTFATLFYKDNVNFAPKLFHGTIIESYKTGVTKWGDSVLDRNQTLEKAYEAAVDVHISARSQSATLNQMTRKVEEVSEKAKEADQALKTQANLIGDLQSAVDDAEKQLSGMSDKSASFYLGCTKSDYCKWTFISCLCCGTIILVLLAVPKWLHLLASLSAFTCSLLCSAHALRDWKGSQLWQPSRQIQTKNALKARPNYSSRRVPHPRLNLPALEVILTHC